MPRNEQLIRQHRLLQILERSRFGRTLDELRDDLVEELGLTSLHTRSVRRDLNALGAAGFHVESAELERGRVWKLGARHRGTHKITASATELMALSLGRELLFPLAGTPFWKGIESFWSKVKEALPDEVWKHYQRYRGVLHVLGTPAKSYENHQGILKTINRAILEHRVVQADYQSIGQTKPATRMIEPYGVVFFQNSLYIVADASPKKTDNETLRRLKLDRFQSATALDKWFTPRDDKDVRDHLARSVGIFAGGKLQSFRIRVSALAAPWVTEDPWHPSQDVTKRRDGSIEVKFSAAHEMEVIPKVLALGAEAELLSPASSRRRIRESITAMAKM